MAMERTPFETAEGHSSPTVRQVSVFLENRVGQLLKLTQLFEKNNIRVIALAVVDSVDFAVVRLLFDDADEAMSSLREAGFTMSTTEVLVVKLPPRGERGLLKMFAALLSAEVNIYYTYPLLPARIGPAVAIAVDNMEMASETLRRRKFAILNEGDLHKDH